MAQTLLGNLGYTTLDATKLSGNLPAISGASLTGISAGKVGQVLSTVFSTETSTSSSSWTTTGHSVTMTPVATSSKILIIFSLADGYINSGNHHMEVRPYSSIGGATAAQASAKTLLRIRYNVWTGGSGYNFLYSPNTTSAVVITNYFKASSTGTVYYHNETSKGATMTLMEVLA